MEVLTIIIIGILTAFIQAGFLYLAIRVCKQQSTFNATLAIAFSVMVVNSGLTLLGGGLLGSLVSWLLMIFLIKKWTSVDDIWPTAILISIVCAILQALVSFLLLLLAGVFFAVGTMAAGA